MLKPERYSLMVRFVVIEDKPFYRATVKELPDLAQYGKTAQEAYDLAIDAIRDLHTAALEDGVAFPEPNEESAEYSGRITLRMPPSLHAKLATFCDRDSTSLNQYIVAVMAATVGVASRPIDVWKTLGDVDRDSDMFSVVGFPNRACIAATTRDSFLSYLHNYSKLVEHATVKYVAAKVQTTLPSSGTEVPNESSLRQMGPVVAFAKNWGAG